MDAGIYFSGYVFSKASPASAIPSSIYTIRVSDCKYGIVIVVPDHNAPTNPGVVLVFKRCFIKHNATHGALVKVTRAAGVTLENSVIRFMDSLFTSTGDVSETAAIYAENGVIEIVNCSIVTNHSTTGKYAINMQSSLATLRNNIIWAISSNAKMLKRKSGCAVTSDYNLYVATSTGGTIFTDNATDVTFANWKTAISGDAQSSLVASGSSPYVASSFSSPSDFSVIQSTPISSTAGDGLTAPGFYEGSAYTDYYGYARSINSGYWDKGAIDRIDANRQSLQLSGGYLKLGPTINHGVTTIASLAQTPHPAIFTFCSTPLKALSYLPRELTLSVSGDSAVERAFPDLRLCPCSTHRRQFLQDRSLIHQSSVRTGSHRQKPSFPDLSFFSGISATRLD
jgi:hypothetical protein